MGFSLLAGGESGFVSGFSSQRHIGMVLVLGAAAMAGCLALCLSGRVIWPVAVVVGKFYMNTRDFQPTTDMYC